MHRWGERLCGTTRWHLLCATLSQGETCQGLWDTRSTWEEHARALAVDPDQPLPAGGPCLTSPSPGPDAEAMLCPLADGGSLPGDTHARGLLTAWKSPRVCLEWTPCSREWLRVF